MTDLLFGILLMLLLAAGLFALVLRLIKDWPGWTHVCLALAAIADVPLYFWLFHDNLTLAKFLPFSNLVILSRVLVLDIACLAAIAWRRVPGKVWRKSLSVAALAAVGLYVLCAPLCGRARMVRDTGPGRWRDGVCIQSSKATCSAAAAAALLHAHGIASNEAEMIRLCLTNRKGTLVLGLYRGLKLKTRGTDWRVEVVGGNLANLRKKVRAGPLILMAGLPRGGVDDPRFERDWGWRPGQAHAVVLFGFTADSRVEIGDPSVGREHWRVEDLQVLWRGQALCLTRRH